MPNVRITGLPDNITINGENFSRMPVKKVQETIRELTPPIYRSVPGWVVCGRGPNPWTLLVEDEDGNRKAVLDAQSMYSKANFGHGNEHIIKPVTEFLETRYAATAGGLDNREYAAMLYAMNELLPFPCRVQLKSGGGEAVDSGTNKLAHKVWYDIQRAFHSLTGRRGKIIVADQCFHGRVSGVTGYLPNKKAREGFAYIDNAIHIPFSSVMDIQGALEAHSHEIIAVLLEPIQGEGGVNIPHHNYLKNVRELCNEHGVPLVFDEVQTGFGRTGRNFAFEHWDVIPDILILGKAFGGIETASAVVARKDARIRVGKKIRTVDLYSHVQEGMDGQTHGRDARIAVAILAAIKELCDENLAEQARVKGEYVGDELRQLMNRYPNFIIDVRGMGLMWAIEGAFDSWELCQALLRHGVWTYPTRKNIMRILPPLVTPLNALREILTAFDLAFFELEYKG